MIIFTEKELLHINKLFTSFINGDEELKTGDFWNREIDGVKKALSVLDKVNTDAEANKLVVTALIDICYSSFINGGFEAEEISEFLSEDDVSIYKKINEEE
jgi:hypothetical protein